MGVEWPVNKEGARAPGLTLTARNAKSQAATKQKRWEANDAAIPTNGPGVMWEQQWTGTARHWGGEASMGSLYGNFQVPSRRPFALRRRFRRCPNLPWPGSDPIMHRGLAAGGGACASATSHVGPTRQCGCSKRAGVIGVIGFCEADFLPTHPGPSGPSPPIGTSQWAPAPEPSLGGRLPIKSHQPIGLKGGVLAALPDDVRLAPTIPRRPPIAVFRVEPGTRTTRQGRCNPGTRVWSAFPADC